MSIEEYLDRLGDHGPQGLMYDSQLRESLLRELVQSLLAERTEQCAKINEVYWAGLDGLLLVSPIKDSVMKALIDKIREGFLIAAEEIRALNQENKS